MIEYLWQFGSLLLVLLGPVPGIAFLIRLQQHGADEPAFNRDCLMALTAWCTLEVLIGLVLGTMQALRLQPLLLSESVLLMAGMAMLYWGRGNPTVTGRERALLPGSDASLFFMGILVLMGLASLWTMLISPVTDFDSLWYHLPTMVEWYQSGTLSISDQVTIPAYYPFTWELLGLLFLVPLQGDVLVTFPNLIAWMLLGFSVYGLSRMCGSTPLSSLLSCSLLLCAPMVKEHMLSLHVDLPLAAFFLCGAYFLLSFHRSRSRWDSAIFIVSLGLLSGIKTSGMFYGALLCAILIVLEIRTYLTNGSPVQGKWKHHPFFQPASLVAAVTAVIIAGHWYARNWLNYDNPLGPFRIVIAGIPIFPGTMDLGEIRRTTSLSGLFSFGDVTHWATFVAALKTNLSVPLILLFLSAGLLPYRIVHDAHSSRRARLIVLAVLLVGAACLYWTTPYSGEDLDRTHQGRISPFVADAMRYAFPLMGLLAVAGASSIAMFPIRYEGFLLMGAITAGMAFSDRSMFFLALIGFVVVCAMPSLNGRLRSFVSALHVLPVRLSMTMLCMVLLALAVMAALPERAAKKAYSFGYFGLVDFLDINVSEQETIGYFMSQPTYVLFGKQLNRRVVCVDARSLSLSEWVSKLKSRNVRVVALGPIDGPSMLRPELAWLESPGGPFTRVYGQNVMNETLLYRLR